MVKFQRLIDVALIFYSCLLTTSATDSSKEPKIIHQEDDYSKLRLVSAVFRHGDRTVDRKSQESYPNDPYKSHNFYPDGDGQLTKFGKKRAYDFGLLLRDRYNSFLGGVYYPPNIYARSTEVIRCKMTLQLVLAALYPPIDIQKWHSELSWQPIDLIYVSPHEDDLLFPFGCETYREIFRNLIQSPEVKEETEKFNDLIEMASNHTGLNITNSLVPLVDLAVLYATLYSEFHMNLTLPKWTQDIFPKGALLDATFSFLALLSNDKLNYLNGGVLMCRIIDDMDKVINGTLEDRKINLFSAHDVNVAGMLHALKISEHYYPAYTSSVIIELHEKDGTYFVKVLYNLGIPAEIIELAIPGCEILCPYNKFIKLMKPIRTFKEPCHTKSTKTDGTYTISVPFDKSKQ